MKIDLSENVKQVCYDAMRDILREVEEVVNRGSVYKVRFETDDFDKYAKRLEELLDAER